MKAPRDGWDADERETLPGIATEIEALRLRHESDPPADLLRAAYYDVLPAELQAEAADNLAANAWSRTLVEGLDAAEASLQPDEQERLLARIQKAAAHAEQPAPRWQWRRPLLAAAAFAVALVGVWTSREMFRAFPPPSPAATTESVAAPPAVQAFAVPLDKPDMIVSTAALTWRGTTASNHLLTDLKPAFDAFRQDDYARADREFAALEAPYPNAIEVFYYGGVSRLFVGDPERAMVALQRAAELADVTFAPEVSWYRAIAEQRTGRVRESRARLDTLCQGTSGRAQRACEALKQTGSGDAR